MRIHKPSREIVHPTSSIAASFVQPHGASPPLNSGATRTVIETPQPRLDHAVRRMFGFRGHAVRGRGIRGGLPGF